MIICGNPPVRTSGNMVGGRGDGFRPGQEDEKLITRAESSVRIRLYGAAARHWETRESCFLSDLIYC